MGQSNNKSCGQSQRKRKVIVLKPPSEFTGNTKVCNVENEQFEAPHTTIREVKQSDKA